MSKPQKRSVASTPAREPAGAASERRPGVGARNWLLGGTLVLLVVLVYLPTLGNGFIWDDDQYVEENVALQSIEGLYDIWFRIGTVPQYYPLVHTTFWVENHLWGLQPAGFHAVNMLLHAISVLLVWRLLTRLQLPGAWLAAAIFAVHPVEVESVSWVTERKNVLSCVLALGAILTWFRFEAAQAGQASSAGNTPRPVRVWPYYAWALVLFLGAMLSKTVTVTVPAVILVLLWWKQGGITWQTVVRLIPFVVFGLALASITVWMERNTVGAHGPEWDFSWAERCLIAGRALWFYASKLVWPDPLIFFYPRWTIDASAWWQYLYPVGALAVMVVLWLLRGRIGRGPLAAVLIFAGVLTPALGFFNVYPFLFSFVADHFQYHASIALIAAAAAGLTVLGRRWRLHGWIPVAVALLVLAPLGLLARAKTHAYYNVETLYEDTLRLNPAAWAAHVNLAYQKQHEGDFETAVRHYRAALELKPDYAPIHVRLGTALYLRGETAAGQAELQQGLAGTLPASDRTASHAHLAALLNTEGRYSEAIAEANKALAINPRFAPALLQLGMALAGRGDSVAGLEKVRDAVAMAPHSAAAQHRLGEMLVAAGQPIEGLLPLWTAVFLRPYNAQYRESLAEGLLAAGDLPLAQQQALHARQLHPDGVTPLNLLGRIALQQGNTAGAVSCFKAALALDPDNATAAALLRRAQGVAH